MHRWSVQYTGRALRPHRTITGKGEVKASAIYTAAYRATSVIPDKDRKQAIALQLHIVRLERIKSASERNRDQERVLKTIQLSPDGDPRDVPTPTNDPLALRVSPMKRTRYGTKALSELLKF